MGSHANPPDHLADTVTLGAPANVPAPPELDAEDTARLLAIGELPPTPAPLLDPVEALAGLHEQPLTLVLLDIDGFDELVAGHGEAAGEGLMAEILERVQARVRHSDRVLRWSRREVLVLGGGNGAGNKLGERLAETLRAAVAAHEFGPIGKVTISIGVTESRGRESGAAVFARLGQLLAATRDHGPGRVVVDHRERNGPT